LKTAWKETLCVGMVQWGARLCAAKKTVAAQAQHVYCCAGAAAASVLRSDQTRSTPIEAPVRAGTAPSPHTKAAVCNCKLLSLARIIMPFGRTRPAAARRAPLCAQCARAGEGRVRHKALGRPLGAEAEGCVLWARIPGIVSSEGRRARCKSACRLGQQQRGAAACTRASAPAPRRGQDGGASWGRARRPAPPSAGPGARAARPRAPRGGASRPRGGGRAGRDGGVTRRPARAWPALCPRRRGQITWWRSGRR
jgi:hypothetical protein